MQNYSNQSEVTVSPYFQNRESVFKQEFIRNMDSRQDYSNSNYSSKKGKRYRSAFTTEQVNNLEKEFKKFPYIGNAHRKEVANALNIPERAVKIWFQNRRMKEKKETVSKEPEIDDQNSNRNAVITNELLNNVPDVPSTNDQRINTLPLLTSVDGTANLNGNDNHPEKPIEISKASFYKELPSNHDPSAKFNVDYRDVSPVVKNNMSPCYKSSAEFSINLCKKYRSDLIYSNQQPKKMKLEDSAMPPIPTMQDRFDIHKSFTQNVPEDLSYNKEKSKPRLSNICGPGTISPNNVGFQPVYVANYAQPYLPAGSMLWKPLNVMAIMPTGPSTIDVPRNLPGNISIAQEQAVPKQPCKCDCHLNPPNPVTLPEIPQPPAQYIITAVPFQNNTKF